MPTAVSIAEGDRILLDSEIECGRAHAPSLSYGSGSHDTWPSRPGSQTLDEIIGFREDERVRHLARTDLVSRGPHGL